MTTRKSRKLTHPCPLCQGTGEVAQPYCMAAPLPSGTRWTMAQAYPHTCVMCHQAYKLHGCSESAALALAVPLAERHLVCRPATGYCARTLGHEGAHADGNGTEFTHAVPPPGVPAPARRS